MRFILFFYLLSLSVITGFVLAEDEITASDFYQEYLSEKSNELKQEPIHHSDVPSEVMQSFSESAFSDMIISQAHRVPASTASNFFSQLLRDQPNPEPTYLLTVATDSNKRNTVLKFDKRGKLINVLN